MSEFAPPARFVIRKDQTEMGGLVLCAFRKNFVFSLEAPWGFLALGAGGRSDISAGLGIWEECDTCLISAWACVKL